MPQLSIIIVNYNVKYFLEECLQSVRCATKNIDTEIFVVDNNSVDGSVEWIKEKFKDVIVIANNENVGFSKANNQAIAIANGEYILLLNPDTVVQEDTFEKCIELMNLKPNAGAIGVKMIDGTGKYLPESKRGYPSLKVALFKMMGLNKLFPSSKYFNAYYMGHLHQSETNEVDILAGAFMFMRKSVIDKVGLLDESFFMYGEDIDLSWRIVKAGFKNYYLSTTQILHYKGESTKKATFNYVKHFYQAMIIFAKKHQSKNTNGLIFLIQLAIYFKGFTAYLKNICGQLLLPIFDASFIFAGLFFIKSFWEKNIITADNFKYPDSFTYIIIPSYIFVWLVCFYFTGVYDKPLKYIRIFRGVLIGSIFISTIYAFLPDWVRFSRAIILLGSVFTLASMLASRQLMSFINPQKNSPSQYKKILTVGSYNEANRVHQIILKLNLNHEWVGIVNPIIESVDTKYLSNISNLKDIVTLFKVNEIIFCAKDVAAQQIIFWMTNIQSQVSFKIVGEEGMSIVGSNSKDTAGDLYAMDFSFSISTPFGRRNKLLIDYLITFCLVLSLPILLIFTKHIIKIVSNILPVLIRKKTWIGYSKTFSNQLPLVLSPVFELLDAMPESIAESTIQHFRFVYAKNYTVLEDVQLILKCLMK